MNRAFAIIPFRNLRDGDNRVNRLRKQQANLNYYKIVSHSSLVVHLKKMKHNTNISCRNIISFQTKLFAILLFISFIFFSKTSTAQNFDIDVLKQTNLHRNQNLDNFFCAYSDAISYVTPLVPIAIYAKGLQTKNKNLQKKGINVAISAGINGILTYSVKQLVNRPRPAVKYPFLTPLASNKNYSMPSGHTSSAFNTATALTMEFPKWYVAVPAYAYAATMGYSRMHIGVHYPTDVLAGAALGAGSAWVSKKVTKWLQKNTITKKYYNQLLF